ADVGQPGDAFAAKGRPENFGSARHLEILEVLDGYARQRVEHVRRAAFINHVVEERAEARAGQLGGRVGKRLDDFSDIQLGGEDLPDAIDGSQLFGLL